MPSECTNAPLRSSPAQNVTRGPWLRLVSQVLALAGEHAQFVSHAERAWTSSLFAGARHHIALTFEHVPAILQGEDFIEKLAEHEFSIAGQIVGDASIIAVHHEALPIPSMTVEAEFLLIEAE